MMKETRRRSLLPLRFVPPLSAAACLALLTGCPKDADRRNSSADQAATTKKPDAKKKPPAPTLRDQNGDTAFLAFVGRLRKAVAAHDAETVAGMMIPEFGYLLEGTPEDKGTGQGVFAYWDRNNLWPELELILNERFVPKDNFMVAPPELVTEGENYHGYRAGLALVNGGWKFIYFVKG